MAPARSRLMSSRLSTSRASWSSDSSAVRSSSSRSCGVQLTSSLRRLVMAALADASGLRRSCPTAASSAVRVWSACGQRLGGGRGLGQPVPLEDHGGLGGERADDALVLGQQRAAAQGEHEGVAGGHLGVGVLRAVRIGCVPALATTAHSSAGPRAAAPWSASRRPASAPAG